MFKKALLSLVVCSALAAGALHAAELTVAFDADPVSLDPQEQISEGTIQMANWIFDPLVRFDSKMRLRPQLAESWEQVSPTVTRFHLRKGVKFHSGREMTADDVVFTFNRIRTSPDYKGLFTAYKGIEKIDDHTVDFTTEKPYPLVVANMTYLFVMDKDFYSGTDEKGAEKARIGKGIGTFASMNASGTGPFTVESRQQGVKSVYVKNPDYWGKTGNVDKFTLVTIKENATRVSALLSGDVDWIFPVPPTGLERIRNAAGMTVYSIPSDRIITLQMNQKVVKPFQDKRVRQAVVYAIDNTALVKKIQRGLATPAGQFSPQGYSGFDPELKPRYDLKKAQALMQEAGYEKGFTLSMSAPNNRYVNDEKVAQAVAAMLAKIGIKADLSTLPKAQYFPAFTECKAGMAMMGWSPDTGDSANYSEYLTLTRNPETGTGQYNCNGNDTPELNALIAQANEMDAGSARDGVLREAAKLEYDNALFVPLYWQNFNWGYTNKITNFPEVVNLRNHPLFQNVVVRED